MSRKNKGSGVFWQSAAANSIRFSTFRNQIINMALSRFEWVGLPSTCDSRYLEWQLLFNGCASIAMSPRNTILSLQAVQRGINMYGNPTEWIALGENGTRYSCNWSNGAIVYDSWTRQTIVPGIEMYAYELADLIAIKDLNRTHQKVPFILKGPVSKRNDMINIYKQISGNEPAIIADNDISIINIDAIKTDVDYLAADIDEDIENTWRKVYGLLGINNAPYKAERQVAGEVTEHSEPAEFNRLAPLECRRIAARHINEVLGTDIDVIWRRDWMGKATDMKFGLIGGDNNDI